MNKQPLIICPFDDGDGGSDDDDDDSNNNDDDDVYLVNDQKKLKIYNTKIK